MQHEIELSLCHVMEVWPDQQLDRELQASLATLLDGLTGVDPLGLPTGRFFFMILPGKIKNRSEI